MAPSPVRVMVSVPGKGAVQIISGDILSQSIAGFQAIDHYHNCQWMPP